MLARLRFPVERSRGRAYPEPDHPYRNAFQRDRDRVVHSRAFRRLEAKTQVFAPGAVRPFPQSPDPHHRGSADRAHAGRRPATGRGPDRGAGAGARYRASAVRPRRRGGARHAQMQRFGERLRPQPARAADRRAFRAALCAVSRPEPVFRGARGDRQAFARFRRRASSPSWTNTFPGVRPPLEAQLIDLADEVAYNTADLDDAFSAGMLTAEDIAAAVPQYAGDLRGGGDAVGRSDRARALPRGAAATGGRAGVGSDRRHRRARRGKPARRASRTSGSSRPGWRLSRPRRDETSRALKRFLFEKVYASPALGEDRARSMAQIARAVRVFSAKIRSACRSRIASSRPANRRIAWCATTSPE